MLTFLSWIKEQKLELPTTEVKSEKKPVVSEKRVRTGYSANYPDAYVASQYPHHYFNPTKATADLDRQNMDKKNIVTPPDSAL